MFLCARFLIFLVFPKLIFLRQFFKQQLVLKFELICGARVKLLLKVNIFKL
jgi:hypothetical protein